MSEIVTGSVIVEPQQVLTMVVVELPCFSGDPFILCDQADWMAVVDLGPFNDVSGTVAQRDWHAVFSRRLHIEAPSGFFANSQGKTWGEEVVAYRCNEAGVVTNWDERIEMRAHTYEAAVRKLRFSLLNDFIIYHPVPVDD
jgi:hypothetical protein